MGWAALYKDILEVAYPQWKRAGTEAARSTSVYPDLLAAIKKYHHESVTSNGAKPAEPLPNDLKQKISNWMSNRGRTGTKESSPNAEDTRTGIPTSRQVVMSIFANAVEKQIGVECDTDPDPEAQKLEWDLTKGAGGYMKYYHRAVTSIHKGLDAEELDLVEETLQEWTENGLPDEIKQRLVSTA